MRWHQQPVLPLSSTNPQPAPASHSRPVQLQSAIHWHIWLTALQHTHTHTHNALLLYVKGKQWEAVKGTESPPVQLLSAKAVKTPDSPKIRIKDIMDGQFSNFTSAPDTSERQSNFERQLCQMQGSSHFFLQTWGRFVQCWGLCTITNSPNQCLKMNTFAATQLKVYEEETDGPFFTFSMQTENVILWCHKGSCCL